VTEVVGEPGAEPDPEVAEGEAACAALKKHLKRAHSLVDGTRTLLEEAQSGPSEPRSFAGWSSLDEAE
jgi:hypothetical protein